MSCVNAATTSQQKLEEMFRSSASRFYQVGSLPGSPSMYGRLRAWLIQEPWVSDSQDIPVIHEKTGQKFTMKKVGIGLLDLFKDPNLLLNKN